MSDETIGHVLVTARNHQFVSEASGLTLLQVHQAYQDAQDAGDVCFVPVTPGFVRNIFEASERVEHDGTGSERPAHRRNSTAHDAG